MTDIFQPNASTQIDLDRIIAVAAVQNGVRITYLNGEADLIVLTHSERNRFLDRWLGITNPCSDEDSAEAKAAG
ncbi:MAG: hypothetical protein O7B79_06280 [SAR324 cluster bacterium]|nr:hypothetical protein [SAR324 cluster bacterium]